MAEEMHRGKARIATFLILATMIAGGSSVFFFAPGAYAAAGTTLTVTGYALDGRPLSMWVVISQSGATVKSGFTPLTFAGAAGTYTVQAHDYSGGAIFFDHWENGSTNRIRTVTLGSDVAITAYYRAPPPPNRAPVAANDSAVMDQDTSLIVNALANDSDADGDTLSLISVGTPAHGAALISTGSVITYTPVARYSGQDAFTYTISDGRGGSSTATVAVQVNFVNYRPAAIDQTVGTGEDTPLPVILGGTDANGDSLSFSIVSGPAHGTLSSISGNRTTYTPTADYSGSDSFSFKASDGLLESSAATVSITISPVNDAPVANGQTSVSTSEDVAKTITLSASDVDGDALSYFIASAPLHGTLTGVAPNLTYTPAANYNGPDSFTFRANDGSADSNVAVVSMTVVPVNDSPAAANDSAATNQGAPVTISVLSNDSDIDGDALSVTSATAPAHGSVTVNADNTTITYRPAAGFSGSDSFSYTVSDGNGGSATATVAVTVRAVQSTYALTVSSVDMYGKPTGGLYTVIKQGSTTTVKTGFTTLSYTGTAGATYSVTVSDYGSTLFDHWQDNGSTARARTVTLSSDTAITAVFRVPTVNLTPTSGPNGTMISVSGTYFTPSSPVTVTYDGRSVAGTTTTTTGAFSASFAAPALGTGFHTVQAVDGKGWKASAKFEDTTPPPPHPLRYLIPQNGIYVALYMYPAGDGALEWQKVIDAKNAHPSVPIVAAFNPNSGPGNLKDGNFVTWVAKLKSAGIIAIGYTHDGYGSRPLADLKADADKYKNWYGADGLFIDEFTNKAGFETHYRDLTAYVKSIGMKMTMGNPGTDVPKSYVGTVDVLNITEGKGYMPISWLRYCVQCTADQGWHYQHDSLYFSYIRYAIGSLDTAFEVESSRWAGLLYITDGDDSDGRWFHVPSYFGTEVGMLDG
jgi:hypothetical protein